MAIEIGSEAPESGRERAVQLARSICSDAEQYGGHACLACQSAAERLIASGEPVLDLRAIKVPHGTSHRTSRTHWARVLLSVGLLGLVLVGGGSPAGASPDDWWFGESRVMIRGAAASQTPDGNYGVGVYARNNGDSPEDAWGQFRFGEDAEGGHGDAGSVHCLTRDANGLMQVSGRIFGSGGRDDAGRDFAVTIDTESEPQRFSGVRFADPGTIAPCSGGTAEFHPVTRGHYESSPPKGK